MLRRAWFEAWRRASACAVLVAATAFAAEAPPAQTVVELQIAANQRLAKIGMNASVGIYCEHPAIGTYYGSGVVISAEGHILTSTTVVPAGAINIEVYFSDKTKAHAEILEINAKVETALLKVAVPPPAFLPLCRTLPKIGETVFSFGNANNMIRLGAGASVSRGTVSGLYQVESADPESTYRGLAVETDAAINPGQDGGALVNSRGQLVGIIALCFSEARWQGIAVPATRILSEIKALADGKLPLDFKPRLEPPAEDTAEGNALAVAASQLAPCLVAIEVRRDLPPETLPRVSWPTVRGELGENWNKLTEEERFRIQADVAMADMVLKANRQLRRPHAPVTGVVISADGYILTSAFNVMSDKYFRHTLSKGLKPVAYDGYIQRILAFVPEEYTEAVNAVKEMTVTLSNGQTKKARLVGAHNPLRLALLKVDASGLPFVDLAAKNGEAKLAAPVALMGIASGGPTPYTLNTGIVSVAERNNGLAFQADLAMNYGNSGGPVLDANGRICGMATDPLMPEPIMGRVLPLEALQQWLIAPNGGISFVTKTAAILSELDKLKKGKIITTMEGGFLGVEPNPQQALGATVVVGRVLPNSPAAIAGIAEGDSILAVDGQAIKSWKDLTQRIRGCDPGRKVTIKIQRPGGFQMLEINGKNVATAAQLQALLAELTDGAVVAGRCVKKEKEMELAVTLGERK